jgi:hypothetical protein
MSWSRLILPAAERRGKRHNLTSTTDDGPRYFGINKATFYLAHAVPAEIEDGSAMAAVRLICSDEAPASPSSESLAKLRVKHPPAVEGRAEPVDFNALSVVESQTMRAIRSLRSGLSGGPNELRH